MRLRTTWNMPICTKVSGCPCDTYVYTHIARPLRWRKDRWSVRKLLVRLVRQPAYLFIYLLYLLNACLRWCVTEAKQVFSHPVAVSRVRLSSAASVPSRQVLIRKMGAPRKSLCCCACETTRKFLQPRLMSISSRMCVSDCELYLCCHCAQWTHPIQPKFLLSLRQQTKKHIHMR